MKRYFLALLFVNLTLQVFSQSNDIIGLHGLIDKNGDQFYEFAGYNIFVKEIETPESDKNISKIKKKYDIQEIQKEYSSSAIDRPNKIIEAIGFEDVSLVHLLYIIEKNNNKSDLILFTKAGDRDINIENEFINLYLEDKLNRFISSIEIDSIDFAGRNLHLGSACRWWSPHNINCMGGQISWSEFDTQEKADQNTDILILKNKSSKTAILSDTVIPILFEGEETNTRRIVYKSHYKRNPLIVYYVSTQVRDRYISCVMSYYGYNRNDYEMPYLLKEVMQLKEIPENAWHKYDIPAREELTQTEIDKLAEIKKESDFISYSLSFKSGAYMPIGGQKDFTGTSPYIAISMNLRNLYSYGMPEPSTGLFIEMGVVLPNDRKWFIYEEKDISLNAKAHSIFIASIGYLYQSKLARSVYWEKYGKIGVAGLTTNKKKPDVKNEAYNVGVFSFGIGTSLRFKRVGVFGEYQFAPYNKSKHLNAGGNSAFLLGLNIVL